MAGNGSIGILGERSEAISAILKKPEGIALDKTGNLFVADTRHHMVRRVDKKTGEISTIAGYGGNGNTEDGKRATRAQLSNPRAIALNGRGELFILEGNSYVRRVDQNGILHTVTGDGTNGFSGDDGQAVQAKLNHPSAIAIDKKANLYIADTENNRVRQVDSNGIIRTVAGSTGDGGFAGDNGLATQAMLNRPKGIAVSKTGVLYIADTGNRRVRRVDSNGVITTIMSALNSPYAVAVDDSNHVFVAERGAHRIRRLDARTGAVTIVAGTGVAGESGDGGPATSAELKLPEDVRIDSNGNLFIAEWGNDRIRRVDNQTNIITTIAGLVRPLGMGPIEQAKLSDPRQIVATAEGMFIAGGSFGTIQHLVNDSLRTVAGRYLHRNATGSLAYYRSRDFGSINGLAPALAQGRIFISETNKHRIQVVSITNIEQPETWTITPFAGDTIGDFSDGPLSRARFRNPSGLLLDENTLYVSDTGNHVIRAINLSTNTVTTIAGTPEVRGYFGEDIPAKSALLFNPQALTKCPNGDFFIADTGNHRIRRIEVSSGHISTVLGDGFPASSGQGTPAFLFPVHSPLGLACDNAGNLFVTSTQGVRLLPADEYGVVDGSGEVQTIYGTSPRTSYPENVTRCLTSIISIDESHVQFTDSCIGMLIELELAPIQ